MEARIVLRDRAQAAGTEFGQRSRQPEHVRTALLGEGRVIAETTVPDAIARLREARRREDPVAGSADGEEPDEPGRDPEGL